MDSLPNEIISHIISWLPGYQSFGTLYGTKLYDYHKSHDKICELFAIMHKGENITDIEKWNIKLLAKYLGFAKANSFQFIDQNIEDIITPIYDVFVKYYYKYNSDRRIIISGKRDFEYDNSEQYVKICLYMDHLFKKYESIIVDDVDMLFAYLLHIVPHGRDMLFDPLDNTIYIHESKTLGKFNQILNDQVISEIQHNPKYSWLGIKCGYGYISFDNIPSKIEEFDNQYDIDTIFHEFEARDNEIEYLSHNPYYAYRYLLLNHEKLPKEKLNILMNTVKDNPRYMYDITRIYYNNSLEMLLPYIKKDNSLVSKHVYLYNDSIRNRYISRIIEKHPKYAYDIIFNTDTSVCLNYTISHKREIGLNQKCYVICVKSILQDPYYTFKYLERFDRSKQKHTRYVRKLLCDKLISYNEHNYLLPLVHRKLI